MTSISRLLRPLDYLRVKHPEKRKYDICIPLFLSILFTSIIMILPRPVIIFGNSGLIKVITEILQILSGFYIASLAAVATFNKEGMDSTMPGQPMILKVKYNNRSEDEELTRRRFLSLLFGYLALLSILLYFLGTTANLLLDNMKIIISLHYQVYAKYVFIFTYLFLSSNLIVTTLIGLFYMVDRIHRQDPTLIPK